MNFFLSLNSISIFFLYISFSFILISTAVSNISILIVVLLGLISIIKEKKNLSIFYENRANLFISLLTLLFLLSYFYTSATNEEYFQSIKKYIKFLYIPVCFYIIKTPQIKENLFLYFIIGSTFVLLLSYMKFFGFFDPAYISEFMGIEYNDKLRSGVTVFQHSIIHGVVFAFYSFICFERASKQSNLLYLILSLMGFFNVFFLNNSRTAYLVAAIMILILIFSFIRSQDYKKFCIILALVILSFSFFTGSLISNRINVAISDIKKIYNNNYDSSVGYRYVWLKYGLDIFYDKPIIGHGGGSFKNSLNKILINNTNLNQDFETQNPHNEFVSIGVQTGIIGILFFIGFFYYFFVYTKHENTGLATFSLVLISSIFNALFYDNVLGIFSVIIISCALRLYELKN